MSPRFTVCKKSRSDALILEWTKGERGHILEIKHFSKRKTSYLVVSTVLKNTKSI